MQRQPEEYWLLSFYYHIKENQMKYCPILYMRKIHGQSGLEVQSRYRAGKRQNWKPSLCSLFGGKGIFWSLIHSRFSFPKGLFGAMHCSKRFTY